MNFSESSHSWKIVEDPVNGGNGITDQPGGIKLQCESHDVRYRNIWIKELDLAEGGTDF